MTGSVTRAGDTPAEAVRYPGAMKTSIAAAWLAPALALALVACKGGSDRTDATGAPAPASGAATPTPASGAATPTPPTTAADGPSKDTAAVEADAADGKRLCADFEACRAACAERRPAACVRMGRRASDDAARKTADKLLRQLCDAGYGEACLEASMTGAGEPRDRKLLTRSCDMGSGWGCLALAAAVERKEAGRARELRARGLRQLEKSCQHDDSSRAPGSPRRRARVTTPTRPARAGTGRRRARWATRTPAGRWSSSSRASSRMSRPGLPSAAASWARWTHASASARPGADRRRRRSRAGRWEPLRLQPPRCNAAVGRRRRKPNSALVAAARASYEVAMANQLARKALLLSVLSACGGGQAKDQPVTPQPTEAPTAAAPSAAAHEAAIAEVARLKAKADQDPLLARVDRPVRRRAAVGQGQGRRRSRRRSTPASRCCCAEVDGHRRRTRRRRPSPTRSCALEDAGRHQDRAETLFGVHDRAT